MPTPKYVGKGNFPEVTVLGRKPRIKMYNRNGQYLLENGAPAFRNEDGSFSDYMGNTYDLDVPQYRSVNLLSLISFGDLADLIYHRTGSNTLAAVPLVAVLGAEAGGGASPTAAMAAAAALGLYGWGAYRDWTARINPSVTIPAYSVSDASVLRADTAGTGTRDTTSTAPRDTSSTGGAAPQGGDLPSSKKSWRERLADRIAGRKPLLTESLSLTRGSLNLPNGDEKSLWLNIKRTAWGTKNNHWTDGYLVGNVGRTLLYYNYGPQALGFIAGKGSRWLDGAPGGFASGWNAANPKDSMKVSRPEQPNQPKLPEPVLLDTVIITSLPDSTKTRLAVPTDVYGDSIAGSLTNVDYSGLLQ